jgi:hypothetical protein
VNPNVGNIVQYIQQYRNTYTHEAIDQTLLTSGYSQADIEAAWNMVETSSPQPIPYPPAGPTPSRWGDEYVPPYQRPKRVVNSPVFWLTLIGFIMVSYVIPPLLIFLGPRDEYGGLSSASPLSWGSYLLLQLGAIVSGLIALGRSRPLAMGLLIGVLMTVVVLPVIFLCIGLGICLVALGGYGFGF